MSKPTKEFALVLLDRPAIIAGGQRKAAATAVSIDYYIYSYSQLISIYSFQGRRSGRDLAVKVELKSPGDSAPGKRKMYSTTDGKAIGHFDAVDVFA